jgi:hypothetical protein
VSFDATNCRWTILGDASEIHRSKSRGAILAVLEDAKEPLSPAEIAANAQLTKNQVEVPLHRMMHSGEVVKPSRGRYASPERGDLVGGRKH